MDHGEQDNVGTVSFDEIEREVAAQQAGQAISGQMTHRPGFSAAVPREGRKATRAGRPPSSLEEDQVGRPGIVTERLAVKDQQGRQHWVRFSRGRVYKEVIDLNQYPLIDEDGFTVVRGRSQRPRDLNVYHWTLHSHDFWPRGSARQYKLFFCRCDGAVQSLDEISQVADGLPLVYSAKLGQIKFRPTSFLANSPREIQQVLQHVSYAVVEEDPSSLPTRYLLASPGHRAPGVSWDAEGIRKNVSRQ